MVRDSCLTTSSHAHSQLRYETIDGDATGPGGGKERQHVAVLCEAVEKVAAIIFVVGRRHNSRKQLLGVPKNEAGRESVAPNAIKMGSVHIGRFIHCKDYYRCIPGL